MRFIVLNRTGADSLFRLAMKEVLKTKGDKLILGYGYLEPNVMAKKSFINNLKLGFKLSKQKEIILIGNNKNDYSGYVDAATILKQEIPDADIRLLIKQKNAYGHRQYHKKLAIKLDKDEVILSIIGSSNISDATYNNGPFNQEVDILLWNTFKVDANHEQIILQNVKKGNYSAKYQGLRKVDQFIKSFKHNINIDLGLDFQLEDILNEVNYYNNHGFDLMFISENSNHYVKENELKLLIDGSICISTVKECLLYLYNYSMKHLEKSSNEGYFVNHYDEFKDVIDETSKQDILSNIQNGSNNLKRTLWWNKINGEKESVYNKMVRLLS